jgi:hypothetical protein
VMTPCGHTAAVTDLESKIATACLATQVHRGLLERAESGEPVPNEELDEAAKIARQTAADVATAEDVARVHRQAMIQPKAATEAPRRLPAGMRIVSGPAYRAWREKCLENPQLAAARGWNPNKPPPMRGEDHIEALVGPEPEAN